MRAATKFISSALLLALALAVGTAWADTEPRQYFTASLTITTTQDEIENRPDTTSSGVLYYDSTYPGVRFEAHTTPDRAGDDPDWVHIWNYKAGTKYILLKERGGVECLNQTGTTALQKIVCPTYQSCGTYCQQDCMSYSCASTYTSVTRRTCYYNGDGTVARIDFEDGNYYYSNWNYYWNRQRLTTWTLSNYDLTKPSSALFGPGFPCAPSGISDSV
ncbi:uncharacterized protein ACA1_033720 [Acanthamoeba castellanii str. Neff]|uniref:Secreted protein n=1 Tax=Acanthamoeba castellanii (strain ATCC 30010 / Neff) TaxID=1257118 RepID=L8GGX2_ACACF|nr:uncharacterized protein ACA1_033720 [Acanthamoeba castellanii str. Neff]ELR12222.1 hypothetical protein ACA1_033720 [Acanthamoeba castellanii str. Neff]